MKLDGQNYREWAFSVKTVLKGYGLVNHSQMQLLFQ
uniref:Uncharacterized protein n=1 Tax=Arundo donax TaxID=35708 RepID=A0A0A9AMY4_ARUDO